MRTPNRDSAWQPQHSVLFGQASCLCFGIGLIIWGLAPAIVERIVTGQTPPLHMLVANSASFTLGAIFIGAMMLIRRRIQWAAWVAFAIAVMLAGVGAAFALNSGTQITSTFLLLLSAETSFATWLAIGGLTWMNANDRAERDAEQARRDAEAERRARGNSLFTHL